jgi:pimeloyl-ACP methyl ester carboxylesterase
VGAGPAIGFIHDTGEDRQIWDAQMALFAPRYTVVRYDMRGWGRSTLTPGVYRHADDLATLLRTLHVEPATVVGFRHGANVAVEYALDHPENVSTLVLVQPFMDGFMPASG